MKILSSILAFLLSLSMQATELHVAKHGDDSNAGSMAKPLLTIQRAADLAQPGDTITGACRRLPGRGESSARGHLR
jgi:hypothetical protein